MVKIASLTQRDAGLLPILLICCGFLFVDQCESQGLTILGPKIIRPDREFHIVYVNTHPKLNVRLSVSLLDADTEEEILSKTVNISRGTSLTNKYSINSKQTRESYSLHIKSTDNKFVFDQIIPLVYDKKNISIFVQTDKPLYKPGDIIRFRVIVTDIDTRPKKNVRELHVQLQDSKAKSIREWQNIKLFNGVFQSAVQLEPSLNLGDWKLTVKNPEEDIVKLIPVKEYVLPTFYVQISSPNILIAQKKHLDIDIEAVYTFGLRLNGTVDVQIFLKSTSRSPEYKFNQKIIGKTNIQVSLQRPLNIGGDDKSTNVRVVATVYEAYSNKSVTATGFIPVFRHPYSVTISRRSQPLFYPSLPFSFDLTVTDHFGTPAESRSMVSIKVEYLTDVNDAPIEEFREPLDEYGSVQIDLTPPEDAVSFTIEAKYDFVDYGIIKTIHAAQTVSRQYLQISMMQDNQIEVGTRCEFVVTCTERMSLLTVVVTARGMILYTKDVRVPNLKKTTIDLIPTPQMSPNATLLVFYNRKEYLIYDDYPLDFEIFNNELKLHTDKRMYFPNNEIYVDVEAAGDSTIFMSAVDQSAMLLGFDGHNLLEKHAREDLPLYMQPDELSPDHFDVMGLFLRTSAQLDSATSRSRRRRSTRVIRQTKPIVKAILYRTSFPESWLWRNYSMEGKDMETFAENIPDTITTWYLSAFAMSPTKGLGVLRKPLEFKVKQDFFMVANLPYSIKRDEVTIVQITIFNFVGNGLTTDVTIYNKRDEIEFIEQPGNNSTQTKAVYVPSDSGVPITFIIKAKKLGDIIIKVQAVNLLKSDAVEHVLRVVPESLLYEYNEARFIELPELNTKKFHLTLNIPLNIDYGTENIKFSVEGDLFRTTVQNLGSLIRLPSGCGEQNMINFVPNIVILDYLTESGTINEADKTKAENYLESGHKNQMKYRRSDGSFSVWGPSDSKGSVFLTAFVAKSYKIASKYKTLDLYIIDSAFDWLAKQQTSSGQFKEVGQVIHADMQGGLRTTSFALTAYVLAAFLETSSIAAKHSVTVNNALDYLASNYRSMDDVYDLAITSYAFSMSNHHMKTYFLDILIQKSIYDTNNGHRYWNRGAQSVEVAGYALLSYIANGRYFDASPIMHWLNTQRFGLGGFPGTQDTFVGLKALAKYAAKLGSNKNDFNVKLTSKPSLRKTIFVTKENSMVIQSESLPSNIRQIEVEAHGRGFGLLQIQYQYYVNLLNQTLAKQHFKIKLDMLNTTTYHVQHLHICVHYESKEHYTYSNMALVEVYFPSGIIATEDSVKDRSDYQKIRKTELRQGNTNVVIYYDNLGHMPVCFEVTAYRRFRVALQRPSYVKAYDYYDPKKFGIVQYSGKVMDLCDICENEDECKSLACNS